MSDTDRRKVQIEASLDATGVREGADDALKAVKGMANGMESEGQRGARGMKLPEEQSKQTAAAMSRAEKSMVGSIQRATAAMQSGGKAGSDYYDMLAKQRGISGDVLKPYIDQLRQAEAAQKALKQSGGISEGQRNAALRGVPAQLQDVVVSLAGGQNAMTVFLQQGSQLLTTFGTAAEMIKGLGGYILGLVNPLTVLGTAAGLLAVAFYQGSQEAREYSKALILSGNAAGTTAGQLALMAESLGSKKGLTQSGAAEALTQIAATGNVATETISKAAEAALRFDQVGVPIKNTVKEFEELGKSPVEASLKLTEQHRYLTAEVFSQIKALQEQGREAEAAKVAQEAYADSIIGRTTQLQEHVGLLEQAWKGLAKGAKAAWDAMAGIGRGTTVEEQLQRQMQVVATLQEKHDDYVARYGSGRNNSEALLNAAQARMLELQGEVNEATTKAMAEGHAQQVQKAGTKAIEAVSKANERALTKQEQKVKALEEYESNIAKIRAANPNDALLDPKLIAKTKASIEEQFKEKGGQGGSTAPASRRLDLSEIQQQMRDELATIDQQQRAVELRRQAGLISEQDFYSRKRELIVQANGTEQKALQAQIDRLEQEKVKGKEALEVRKQLVDVRGRLSVKVMEGENKLAAVDQDAAMAMERQKAALESLTKTHQRYIEQLDKQQERTIAAAWMGDKERGRAQGKWQIEDRYLAEQRRLEDRQMFTPGLSVEQRQQIEHRLQELQVEKDREIQVYDQTYQQLDLLQEQWQLGASVAWQNFADNAANTARQTADVWTTALNGVAENLANLVVNGKASLGDLLRTLAMMEARTAFSKGIVSLGGAVRSVLGFDDGGYTGDGGKLEPAGIVHKGEFVINAENTKRLGLSMLNRLNGNPQGYSDGGLVGGQAFGAGAGLVGATAGTVIIDVDVNVQSSGQAQVSATAAGNTDSSMSQLGKIIGNAVRERIAQEMRPGGLLWSQRNGRA